MAKERWLEVTYVAVTCWVFAGIGDLATIVSMAVIRPDLMTFALMASVILAFLGFHNVLQCYTYWADQYYRSGRDIFHAGTYQAVGRHVWDLWIPLSVLHMTIMGGIVGCASLVALLR